LCCQLPDQDAHQRGLARAVGPDHAKDLALVHFEVHAAQYRGGAVGEFETPGLDQDRAHGAVPGCSTTSAGIPTLKRPPASSTSTLMRYTRSTRSSRVSTVLGVNSACGETKLRCPWNTASGYAS